MSQHVEWLDAAQPFVSIVPTPGEFEDSYGTPNDKPVLLLGFDDLVAIEGTKEELSALLTLAQRLVEENL